MTTTPPSPKEVRQPDRETIEILWRDGHQSLYKARDLRILCPCAGCVHEVTMERLLKPETVPQVLFPTAIKPVGRYALEFTWSDGHSTGIYTYEMLLKNCPCSACKS